MKHLLQFFATALVVVAVFSPGIASAQCSGGIVSPASAVVCSGGSQTFSVTGATGNIWWQTSPSPTGPWTNVGGSSNATFTLTGITGPTYVQVQADSSGCPLQFSNTGFVTLSTTPNVSFLNITGTSVQVTWFPSGSNQYNVSWSGAGFGTTSNAASPYIITGLNPGTPLCVTVTPTFSCPGVFSGQSCLADTNLYIEDTIITNSICGQANGAIDVEADGGIPPYSFLWSNGATNEDQEFLSAGVYSLSVTDANGNTLDALFSIENNSDTLDIIFVETPGTGGLFNLEAVILNGTSPFMFSWSSGDTGSELTDVAAGLYTVTAIDANGCGGAGSFTAGQLCGYDMAFTYTLNGNILTTEVTNSDPGLTYTWSTNFSTQTQSGESVSFNIATPYGHIVCLTASDSACVQNSCEPIVFSSAVIDSLSGLVWNDGNANGIFETGEVVMADAVVNWVSATDSTLFGSIPVNPDGTFDLALLAGAYFVSSYHPGSNYSQSFPLLPSAYTVVTTGGMHHQNLNFGFQFEGVLITGRVFFDANGNGTMDSTESGVPNTVVHGPGFWVTTNQDGYYSMHIPVGLPVNVTYASYWSIWSLSTPWSYSVSPDSAGFTYGPYLFGVVASPQDLSVVIIKEQNAVPGFIAKYKIKCTNMGASAMSGSVSFITHSSFIPTTAAWGLDYNSGDTAFTNLLPGHSINCYAWYNVPTTATLGTAIVASASVSPVTGDGSPANNVDTVFHNVVGGFDPNDKSVSPPGTGTNGAIDPDNVETLTYTIRFQNTGTWYATNVILVDTLSPYLDWNSIQMNGASHNYTAQLNDTTGVLTFFFNNIMLPDSNTNEPESHGYAQFEINLDSTLALGTVIENFADIYFDFNEPVRTNTVVNTLEEVIINSLYQPVSHQGVSVYPNPAGDKIYWKTNKPSHSTFVTVYNVLGVAISSFKVDVSGFAVLERGHMPSGLYFFEVTTGDNPIDKGTFVWE